jgi:hypothetical protein
MTPYKNKNLIKVLRQTLENVEHTSGVRSDDPALEELRSILNRRVEALEHSLASEFAKGASESLERDYLYDFQKSESSRDPMSRLAPASRSRS